MKEGIYHFSVSGHAVEVIHALQQMTGANDEVAVIVDALRLYQWVLAQEAKGRTVTVLESTNIRSDLTIEPLIKDMVGAESYFSKWED